MAEHTPEVRALRRRLREARLQLDADVRRAAERAICTSLLRLPSLRRGARIAAYVAMPGEVALRGCCVAAARRGITIYLPRITSLRRRSMVFVRWTPDGRQRRNAFGIDEPATGRPVQPVVGLDVVIVPLVGFDRRGNRLGMGGGYYDRALRRRRDDTRRWCRPQLVGVAFSLQEVPAIAASPWDVPLDLVVTEREVIVPRRALPPRTVR